MTKTIAFVDDHNNKITSMEVVIATLRNGVKVVCPIQTPCSLNPLYIGEDNLVHLSTWSLGTMYSEKLEVGRWSVVADVDSDVDFKKMCQVLKTTNPKTIWDPRDEKWQTYGSNY